MKTGSYLMGHIKRTRGMLSHESHVNKALSFIHITHRNQMDNIFLPNFRAKNGADVRAVLIWNAPNIDSNGGEERGDDVAVLDFSQRPIFCAYAAIPCL